MGITVSDFISVATAYGGEWSVLSLTASSSHRQCVVNVLVIAVLEPGRNPKWDVIIHRLMLNGLAKV